MSLLMSAATESKVRFPPFRAATHIHDRDDQNFCIADLIKQAVRKPMRPTATRSRRKGQPSLGMRFDQSDGGFNFNQEIRTKTSLLGFVELHCRLEFRQWR